jgi:translation initiation factor 2 alpha subunit (eIF-2alpha)
MEVLNQEKYTFVSITRVPEQQPKKCAPYFRNNTELSIYLKYIMCEVLKKYSKQVFP